LRHLTGCLFGAEQKAKILRSAPRRGRGGTNILSPRTRVENLPLIKTTVGADFNESRADANGAPEPIGMEVGTANGVLKKSKPGLVSLLLVPGAASRRSK
jgi:hypothetical protein